jgi:hypothetical protein
MTQLQNHGTTNRLYIMSANALTKDKAVNQVEVSLDTSKWSSRKRNIVVNSLRTGVAACGWEMAELIETLSKSVGSSVNTISRWKNYVYADDVRPEMLDEFLAYTAAWLRMDRAAHPEKYDSNSRRYYYAYSHCRALDALDRGERLDTIPLSDSMSYDEKREFIHKYLKASEDRESDALERMIAAIEAGETLKISYSN